MDSPSPSENLKVFENKIVINVVILPYWEGMELCIWWNYRKAYFNIFVKCWFYRSLTSTYLKKAGKAVPPSTTTSSQYLGTLKVLDNKHLQKYSAELDKADHLRAAVYQVNFSKSPAKRGLH